MGIPEKRRAVGSMARRWQKDLVRLHALFGEYTENDFSDDSEMQRNLGTALAYAQDFLASRCNIAPAGEKQS